MKILIIAETLNFETFTRRATIEAIAKLDSSTQALCHTHIKNIFKLNLFSKFIKVRCLFYVLPMKKSGKLRILRIIENHILKIFWQPYFNKFNVVMFTSPNQAYLLKFLTNRHKTVFLISDPYHLMGYQKESEQKIIYKANILLVTALDLKFVYLNKYFAFNNLKYVIYWPNTVDLEIWNYHKLKALYLTNENLIFGFSGNFMDVVDLDLLDYITSESPDITFELAGKISYLNKPVDMLNKIFSKKNVKYLGYINYNDLPRKVITWDVCLMLDAKTELARYHHHNKLYQYLALGKPVILHKNNNDYDVFDDQVLIANTYAEYVKKIEIAKKLINNISYKEKALSIARRNSSIRRARELINVFETNLYVA